MEKFTSLENKSYSYSQFKNSSPPTVEKEIKNPDQRNV